MRRELKLAARVAWQSMNVGVVSAPIPVINKRERIHRACMRRELKLAARVAWQSMNVGVVSAPIPVINKRERAGCQPRRSSPKRERRELRRSLGRPRPRGAGIRMEERIETISYTSFHIGQSLISSGGA